MTDVVQICLHMAFAALTGIDWQAIRSVAETGIPLATVAQEFGVSFRTVQKRAQREDWLTLSRIEKASATLRETRAKAAALSPELSPKAPGDKDTAEIVANVWEKRQKEHKETLFAITSAMWETVRQSPPKVETVGDAEKLQKITRLNLDMSTGEPAAVMQVLLGAQADIPRAQARVEESEIVEGEMVSDEEWQG